MKSAIHIVLLFLFLPFSLHAQVKLNIVAILTASDMNDEFWQEINRGISDAAKLVGVRVETVWVNPNSPQDLLKRIDRAISSKPDGLMLSIPNYDQINKAIKYARSLKIPIISFNSGALSSHQLGLLAHIGADEYAGGLKAGLRFRALGKTKMALCLTTIPNNQASKRRCNGFFHGLSPNIKYKYLPLPNTNSYEQRNIIKNYLDNHRQIDTILVTDIHAYKLLSIILKKKEYSRIQFVATFDITLHILQEIKKGRVLFSISQQGYLQGYLPIILLTNYLRYSLSALGFIKTGPYLIDKTNIDSFEAGMVKILDE